MLAHSFLRQFKKNGFLAIESMFTPAEVEEARLLLDGLYGRFGELPPSVKRDLAEPECVGADPAVRTAEIDQPTRLDPRLKQSAVYRKCRAIARLFGGVWSVYSYDHLIYKTPFNGFEVSWHQDEAYTGFRQPDGTVHFWIPLQDASVENGCMHFLPGSHLRGPKSHVMRSNGHTLAASGVTAVNAVACPLRAGGLTMHTPLTLHYTGPNTTDSLRRAWIIQFRPWGRFARWHPPTVAARVIEGWRGAAVLPVDTAA